jgi:hypothetical protein
MKPLDKDANATSDILDYVDYLLVLLLQIKLPH